MTCEISPAALDVWLTTNHPTAVYLTSPDYLGNTADLAALAVVCHRHDCLLVVDNAHGAYLRFLPQDIHPITLGADLCCDSAHKTLPVLTGGGYLHISRNAPILFSQQAERAMSLFASTSPSYLILQSLDACNRYLAEEFPRRLAQASNIWAYVRAQLLVANYVLAGKEPLKITILPKPRGYTGQALALLLESQNIFCEFYDPDHLVLMLPVEAAQEAAQALLNALLRIPPKAPITSVPPPLPRPQPVMSAHDALFADSEEIPVASACGCVMASAALSCPPAIPILVCGERIDEQAIALMRYYGTEHISVVRSLPHQHSSQEECK